MTNSVYKKHHKEVQLAVAFYDAYMGGPINEADGKLFSNDDDLILRHALETDPTGVAFWSAFTPLFSKFTNTSNISLNMLSKHSEKSHFKFNDNTQQLILDYHDMRQAVGSGEMTDKVRELESMVRNRIGTISGHQLSDEKAAYLVNNISRYQQELDSCFKHIERLAVTKTKQAASTPPKALHNNIVQLHSQFEAIDLALNAPEGFTLALMIHPERFENSYFIWYAKSDGTVLMFREDEYTKPGGVFRFSTHLREYIRDKYNHDDKAYVFPYSLMEVISNNEVDTDASAVEKYNRTSATIGTISSLEPNVILQMSLTTEIIANNWSEEVEAAPLVYHDDMLRLNQASVTSESRALDTVNKRTASVIPLMASTLTHEQYKGLIESVVENPDVDTSFIIRELESAILERLPRISLLPDSPVEVPVPAFKTEERTSTRYGFPEWSIVTHEKVTLEPLPPLLGAKEDVLHATYRHARSNQAKLVEAHLLHDFQSEQDKIEPWLTEALYNSGPLQKLFASLDDKLFDRQDHENSFFKINDVVADAYSNYKSLHGSFNKKTPEGYFDHNMPMEYYVKKSGSPQANRFNIERGGYLGELDADHRATCPITGAKATIFVKMQIENAFVLSQLLGIDRSELPYGLSYVGLGNRSSDAVHGAGHPACGMKLNLHLGVSLKGLAQWADNHGLEKPTWKHPVLSKR